MLESGPSPVFYVNKLFYHSLFCLSAFKDDSHLLLHSHVTMEDLESEEFKVHDPCAAWLNGEDPYFKPRIMCSFSARVLDKSDVLL